MYAIIKSGGKQYKVAVGDLIDVDHLGLESGSEVKFDVLFVNDGNDTFVGVPTVTDFIVNGELVDGILGPKVIAYKYQRRKRHSVKRGHRQQYSRVKITGIATRKNEK